MKRRAAPRAGRLQPEGELEESKRKQMKAKLLSFAFMSFSESGLFKGLRAKKIKNPTPSQLASWVARQGGIRFAKRNEILSRRGCKPLKSLIEPNQRFR
jgi:hypothetical protein